MFFRRGIRKEIVFFSDNGILFSVRKKGVIKVWKDVEET